MTLRKHPWWTPDAVKFIDQILTKESNVLEFGCGGSTPWLADRCNKLITIEHHPEWFKRIIKTKKKNLDARLLKRPYHKVCDEFEDNSFDLVIIDGRDRVKCFKAARKLVRSGGFIMLDDASRGRYEEAWESVKDWEILKTRNKQRELKIGSCNTWIWKKPEK